MGIEGQWGLNNARAYRLDSPQLGSSPRFRVDDALRSQPPLRAIEFKEHERFSSALTSRDLNSQQLERAIAEQESDNQYAQAPKPTSGTTGQSVPDDLNPRQRRDLSIAKESSTQVIELRRKGQYGKALPLAERVLKLRENVLGPRHILVATSLNNLALLYSDQGQYERAISLFQRSIQVSEALLGAYHPKVAVSLNNLAGVYFDIGDYTQAKSLFQRTIGIYEQALGPEHLRIAASLSNLAVLQTELGNNGQAELLHQRALKIYKENLGVDHPSVATSLNNLAYHYTNLGNYRKGEALYQQALEISEKALGPNHPSVAVSLNNLAILYSSQEDYARAEPLHQRALRINEKVLGADHPKIATDLQNLAQLYSKQDNYRKAEPMYQRALRIQRKTVGDQHPRVANSLSGLAWLYRGQAQYDKAESLFREALDIYQSAFGPTHPWVANAFSNLAWLYQAQDKTTRTYEVLKQAIAIEEQNLKSVLSIGSEAKKRSYIKTLSRKTNATISNHLQQSPRNLQSAQLAFRTVLQRKGRILAALTDSFQSLRQDLTPADQTLFDRLQKARSQYATLMLKNTGGQSALDQDLIRFFKDQEEALEEQLARRSIEFRTENQPVTIAAIQQQLPAHAALVELIRYRPYNTRARRQVEQWQAPHYAAYILRAEGQVQWVDLGEAEPIDQSIFQFRTALESRSITIQAIARRLDQQVMQPIRAKLGNTRQLLLSPDSQLNLISFAALVDENNQYLVETYDITYLSSGRDLLRLQSTAAKSSLQPPLIMANPDYQKSGAIAKGAIANKNRGSRDLNLTFGPLPGTQQEAAQLHRLLPKATLLTADQATENILKQVKSPRILHIATHGFFLETDLEAALNPSADRAGISIISSVARPKTTQKSYENPLLRSGLALAGANTRRSGEEDGIFTALEATGLNLRGTQLVVLSACETGLGDVANGEGVYGLRRAFVMAGSESQVLSLWKVDDVGTKDLMVKYYQRLLQQAGRSEALRQTQLEMLRSQKYQHPYYWAAFIPSGNWKPMN
ncbi:Photosystem I assembly protein Ycf3 [Acaryochloris thomasi RCC1774]|uniref:Photosystem I assembly protein Ycf3 n=2 Tax=Acaryochloris TaxID=155977 RepID=A0A2W1JSU6_9CYAN|nr:Photosystem I assembly protein Ycf3 [Acaryochloris thomasi RCC1774]